MKKTKTKTDNPLLSGADFPADLSDPLVARLNPPVLAKFALEPLVRAVLGSYSLSLLEKQRIFESIPTLSMFQHDALMEVFREETEEFVRLMATEARSVLHLAALAWVRANLLAGYYGVGYATRQEEEDALTTLLAHKYDTRQQRAWIEESPLTDWAVATQVIFGRLRQSEAIAAETDLTDSAPMVI